MFKAKSVEDEQLNFASPYIGIHPKRLKRLEESWAGLFYKEVYSKIDEEPFSVLFSGEDSRPNVPIRTLLSALILKEMRGYSDKELMEAIDFDLQIRYALGLKLKDEGEAAFCERTLNRFRTRLYNYELKTGIDLIHGAVTELLENFNKKMGTNRKLKRMDSFQVSSNIKNLSRLRNFYETTKLGVKAAKKNGQKIPKSLQHYLDPNDANLVFYYDKTTDYDERVNRQIFEIKKIRNILKSCPKAKEELALVERLMEEQLIEEDGKTRLKKNKAEGLNARTLQSPHDPDATFRQKKGPHIGYVANVSEAASEDGYSMITGYQYEQNTYSDQQFFKDALKEEEPHPEDEPMILITDGAYASVENALLAKSQGIDHVATELVGRKTEDFLADFVFNDDGTEILACPGGLRPKRCGYAKSTGQCRAVFDKAACEACPHFKECHPKEQKKTMVKILSVKSTFRAKAQKFHKEEAFKELSHFRNGSEAIPAVLRRKYKLDRMPVRGLVRTRQLFGLKIAGLATIKFLRCIDERNHPKEKCACF